MKYRELRGDFSRREVMKWWFMDSILWPPNWFNNWRWFKRTRKGGE